MLRLLETHLPVEMRPLAVKLMHGPCAPMLILKRVLPLMLGTELMLLAQSLARVSAARVLLMQARLTRL